MVARVCLTCADQRLQVFSTSWRLTAPSLLALFHARSALGVPPSGRCSSRAAVRRLRRRCPPVVGPATRSPGDRTGHDVAPKHGVKTGTDRIETCEATPAFRALLHARVRHEDGDGLDRRRRVALLGFLPSRVLSLVRMSAASTAPPLMWFPGRAQATDTTPLQGIVPDEVGWPLSRLPTLLGFFAS